MGGTGLEGLTMVHLSRTGLPRDILGGYAHHAVLTGKMLSVLFTINYTYDTGMSYPDSAPLPVTPRRQEKGVGKFGLS